jgi:hypothetical protein
MDETAFEWLVAAVCLCVEVASLIVVPDVCGLEAKKVEEAVRWATFTLLRASLGKSESPDTGCSGHGQDAP